MSRMTGNSHVLAESASRLSLSSSSLGSKCPQHPSAHVKLMSGAQSSAPQAGFLPLRQSPQTYSGFVGPTLPCLKCRQFMHFLSIKHPLTAYTAFEAAKCRCQKCTKNHFFLRNPSNRPEVSPAVSLPSYRFLAPETRVSCMGSSANTVILGKIEKFRKAVTVGMGVGTLCWILGNAGSERANVVNGI